eukprot:107122-Pelagomonas_calceolata.AAC.1
MQEKERKDEVDGQVQSFSHIATQASHIPKPSGRGRFLHILYRVGMELSCKLGRPLWVNP